MGRLIDADSLKEKFGACMFKGDTIRSIINEQRSVEAIPKADYEARLKADMVAILTDLLMDIEECVDGAEGSPQFEQGVTNARNQVVKMIQQKINALKAESE